MATNKSDKKFYLISGLLGLFLLGLWYSANSEQFFRTPYVIKVPDAGGMVAGNPVWVNGPIHGEVIAVSESKDGHAFLEIELERGVELTTAATMMVKSKGMVGKRVLDIQLNEGGEPFQPGDTLVGGFEQGPVHLVVFAQTFFKGIVEAVGALESSYNETLGDSLHQEKLAELGQDLKAMNQRIKRLSNKYAKEIPETVNQGMSALRRIGDDGGKIYNQLSPTVDELKLLKQDIEKWDNNLQLALAPIEGSVQKINEGQGSLGRLLKDPKFNEEFKSLKANVDSLAKVFNQGEIVVNADIF